MPAPRNHQRREK